MPCPEGWRPWAAAIGLTLLAQTAAGDAVRRAELSAVAGSERLRIFAYGKLLETGNAPRSAVVQMKQDMVRQGFYFDPGSPALIATEAWVAPVLSYDGNINGGVLQDSFVFNGFLFQADPEYLAKAGVVGGLQAGGVTRLAWANGRYVEARLRAEAVWSPEHQIGRGNAELALCSRNHVAGWTFADLCHTASVVSRELGRSTAQETALSLSQMVRTGAAYHELTVELTDTRTETASQPGVTLTWGALWDGAATELSLTHAAPVDGEIALENRVAAEMQWLWRGHAMGLGLWYQTAGGGAFLGTPRDDRSGGISLSYQSRPGLTVQVGYMANRSTADFFDYEQVTLNTRFDALRW